MTRSVAVTPEYFNEIIGEYMELMDMSYFDAHKTAVEELTQQGADMSLLNLAESNNMQSLTTHNHGETLEQSNDLFLESDDQHLKDNRQEMFFQTDRELETTRERNKRVEYLTGSARKLNGKGLSVCVLSPTHILVGQSNHNIVLFRIQQPTKSNPTVFFKEAVFTGHAGPVIALARVTDTLFLSGAWDCKVFLWSTHNNHSPIGTFIGHNDYIKSIQVQTIQSTIESSNSEWIISFFTSSVDKTVRKWVARVAHMATPVSTSFTYELVSIFKDVHSRSIEELCIADDSILIAVSSDNSMSLYDTETNALIDNFTADETSIFALCKSDEYVFTGSADKSVIQWAIKRAPNQGSIKMDKIHVYKMNDWVRSLCVEENSVFVGLRNGAIHRIDISDRRIDPSLIGCHFDGVDSLAIGCKHNQLALYSASWDGTVRVWPIHTSLM